MAVLIAFLLVSPVTSSLFASGVLYAAEGGGRDQGDEGDEGEEGDQGDEAPDEWSNQQQSEGESVLERIRKLMGEVEQDLANFLVGEPTQDKQRKILEQIDEVIKQAQQQQQSECSSSDQQQQQKDKERQERERQRQERRQKSREEMEREREQQRRQEMANPENNQQSDQNQEQRRVERIKEVRQGAAGEDGTPQPGEQWGNFPPRLREDAMDARSRDFPERYRDLIERFYRRLAE